MQPRKLQYCIWRGSIKPSLRFSWFCVFFVSIGNPLCFLFYSTVAGVVPCGCRKVSPYIIIVQVIFHFLWGHHWAHPGYFDNRIPHKPALGVAYAASQTTVLHMKRLNQTESPIFVILCVYLFPKAILFDFYYIALLSGLFVICGICVVLLCCLGKVVLRDCGKSGYLHL